MIIDFHVYLCIAEKSIFPSSGGDQKFERTNKREGPQNPTTGRRTKNTEGR